jgi:hypothetical protein
MPLRAKQAPPAKKQARRKPATEKAAKPPEKAAE